VRKLEFLLGEAASIDADTLVTVGAPQSNTLGTVAGGGRDETVLIAISFSGGNRPSAPTGALSRTSYSVESALRGHRRLGCARVSCGGAGLTSFAGGSASVRHAHWRLTRVGALGFVGAFMELMEQIPLVRHCSDARLFMQFVRRDPGRVEQGGSCLACRVRGSSEWRSR